jgi:hypothetical protein
LRQAAVTIITPGWAHENDLSHCGTRLVSTLAHRDPAAPSAGFAMQGRVYSGGAMVYASSTFSVTPTSEIFSAGISTLN